MAEPGVRISVSPLPSNGPYDFIREWKQYAEETGRDLFFKFFCYFLGFNHLYESRDLWSYKVTMALMRQDYVSDLDKVLAFLSYAFEDEDGPRLSVVVEDKEYELLNSVKWHHPKTGDWVLDNPKECSGLRDKVRRTNDIRLKTMLALTKVYRVRCNLFHGEKHVTEDRDKELVEVSSALLGRLLESCMEAHLGLEHLCFSEGDQGGRAR